MVDAMNQELPVLFRKVATTSGHYIGIAQLNAPKSLNALSLAMIRLLDEQLRLWVDDPAAVCVVIHGAGEKAFCAGGDVRSVRAAIIEHGAVLTNEACLTFFAEEYRLDHRIHIFPKPILVFGDGIVMGGGVGLLVGASHRVVTERSRLAMPEISIGLFPDVAGSWFLQRMPGRTGLFAALTAIQLNAHDARIANLADYFMRSTDREALFEQLAAASWKNDTEENHHALSALLISFADRAVEMLPVSILQQHMPTIESLCAGDSLATIVDRIVSYDGDDEWLRRGAHTLRTGSPTTAALIWELQRRTKGLPLADVFRLELIVAVQCCVHPDFPEGVRSVLVDKDHAPRWHPERLAQVTPSWVDEHFAPPPWPQGVHPLADI
jgi:enoyl-CoA hydratase/carnithine racemase